MIRKILEPDKSLFMGLVDEFYHTDAVLHIIPEKYYVNTFNEIIKSDVYLEGYILEHEKAPAGYAIISKSFSPEVGGKIIWIEEIYIKPEFQGKGIGKEFFKYINTTFSDFVKRFRLEVEENNSRAVSLYQRLGFEKLNYLQMVKDIDY